MKKWTPGMTKYELIRLDNARRERNGAIAIAIIVVLTSWLVGFHY